MDGTGTAGKDIDQELDLVVDWRLTPHASLLLGYSHLFAGSFLANTGNGEDGRFFLHLAQFQILSG